MAASSVALPCPRLFFLHNNNNEAIAAAGADFSSMKPLRLPIRRRKSLMLRSASVPATTIPVLTKDTTTATKNRVSIYSSSAVADPDFAYKQQLVEEASKTTVGIGTRRSSKDREEEEEEDDEEAVLGSKLDDWISDSVTEIVRNIGEAPFLVHIYSSSSSNETEGDDDGSSSSSKTMATRKTRFERESAVSEDWPRISRRWKENGRCRPDGIILVEQLKGDEEEEDDDDDGSPHGRRHLTEYSSSSGQCQCSKSWGIVIQARGLHRAACYILKTSRVRSSVGFCTHFCLVRAKCFGEPAELQLRDCWLQRP